MTQKERIEMLLKLYNYYEVDYQQNVKEVFDKMIDPNSGCDKLYFECASSALTSQTRTFTSPLFNMLRAEDVISVEKTEDGKTLVATRSEQFVFDFELGTSYFMIEVPIQTIAKYRSGTEIKDPPDEEI